MLFELKRRIRMDLDRDGRSFIDLYNFGLEVNLLLLQLLGDVLLYQTQTVVIRKKK